MKYILEQEDDDESKKLSWRKNIYDKKKDLNKTQTVNTSGFEKSFQYNQFPDSDMESGDFSVEWAKYQSQVFSNKKK